MRSPCQQENKTENKTEKNFFPVAFRGGGGYSAANGNPMVGLPEWKP
jgi:hypothetical protein